MIAAPLKMNKPDSAITTVFGKAKFFGIYDKDKNKVDVIENPQQGGPAVLSLLKEKGVNTILTQHLGQRPLMVAHELNMNVYHCTKERMTLTEASEKFQTNDFTEITMANLSQFSNH